MPYINTVSTPTSSVTIPSSASSVSRSSSVSSAGFSSCYAAMGVAISSSGFVSTHAGIPFSSLEQSGESSQETASSQHLHREVYLTDEDMTNVPVPPPLPVVVVFPALSQPDQPMNQRNFAFSLLRPLFLRKGKGAKPRKVHYLKNSEIRGRESESSEDGSRSSVEEMNNTSRKLTKKRRV
ncbi:hypothetical protein MKEN_00549000 [Mycena kentingensis (nom. inval.)]|nr:hypothetical protein MKEN_00549000 [Mycena kentingensis (nom. inval.)]